MKSFFILITLPFILLSCKENQEQKLTDNIKKLEANKSLANSDTLINSYLSFVKQFPDNANAIKFLFKAAEGNVKAKRYAKAAAIYEQLATMYMDDKEYTPEALIRAGFLYESIADKTNAKRVFNEFLTRFPKHDRVEDIIANLSLIDLTKEQQDSVMMARIPKQ